MDFLWDVEELTFLINVPLYLPSPVSILALANAKFVYNQIK